MPRPATDPGEQARTSRTAGQAALGPARDRGAELTTRPIFPGSELARPGLEPLDGARAARDIELAARRSARDYTRAAREAGHGWNRIGEALGLTPDPGRAGNPPARPPAPTPSETRQRDGDPLRPVLPLAVPVLQPGSQRPRPGRRARRPRARPRRRRRPAGRSHRAVGRQVAGRAVTSPSAWRRFVLADDGIIDPIAVEIAARGLRPVALTPAERRLAAARILACGGNANLICERLHVSWATALTLAARCQGLAS